MAEQDLASGPARDLLALLGGVEVGVGEDFVVVAAAGLRAGRCVPSMGFR